MAIKPPIGFIPPKRTDPENPKWNAPLLTKQSTPTIQNRQNAQNALGRAYGRTQRTTREPRLSRPFAGQLKALKRKGSL